MNPKNQRNPYNNPWPLWVYPVLFLWKAIWLILCSWTPKFFNPWRLSILKLFGANIYGTPFVHSTTRIQVPWHLTLRHRSCLGEIVCAYSLGQIEVGEFATVAQEVYLCTGTHDFAKASMQLITDKIYIGKNSFVGVRAVILPGVKIGENAVVGAMAVVTREVFENQIVAGNPAKIIGTRAL